LGAGGDGQADLELGERGVSEQASKPSEQWERKSEILHARISKTTKEKLEKKAAEKNRPVAQIIRDALEKDVS
jgi:hypothetical protein